MIYLNTVDSTNTFLKRLASDGCLDRTAVVAAMQTNGRGRQAKKFYSPLGTGLYMSILVKSQCPETNITTMAAVAVCRVIERFFAVNAAIKWVNDVFIGGKKVCGILTEGVTGACGFYAVVGIGLNVFFPKGGFEEEIKEIASAVSYEEPNDEKIKLIAEAVYNEFFAIYESGDFKQEYKNRCITLGRNVTLTDKTKATAIDIDDNMHLVVETADKRKIAVQSGEVEINYA